MVRKIRKAIFPNISHLFALLKKQTNRVDYVDQVEEILAATQAKGARLFRRPKMSASASVDRCVSAPSLNLVHSSLQSLHWINFTQNMSSRALRTDLRRNVKLKPRRARLPK